MTVDTGINAVRADLEKKRKEGAYVRLGDEVFEVLEYEPGNMPLLDKLWVRNIREPLDAGRERWAAESIRACSLVQEAPTLAVPDAPPTPSAGTQG